MKHSQSSDFRIWLQQEFTARCKNNPRYSLRAFAKLLKMEASSISQIFSGKRKASTKVITNVCAILGATPYQQERYIANAKARFKTPQGESRSAVLMDEDTFKVISEWYHFAILELVNTEGFQGRGAWIARALGISTAEAQIAFERVERLQLIRNEEGRWVRTSKLLSNFSPGMTSAAHKNLQRQILQMALAAVDNTEAEAKDITGMTMAINMEKLPEARKIIAKFRRDMSAFLEEGPQSRVYQLGVQLYPLSKEMNS